MKFRTPYVIAIAAVVAPTATATHMFAQQATGTAAVAASELAAARALYASASYEEALGALSTLDNASIAADVEELRALCFLALGRLEDAEQALERIVRRHPLHAIKEGDVTPKLVTMFQEVRRRILPDATRELFTRAKADFDAKKYATAVPQFKTLLALVGDKDLAMQASMADLKMLAEGFLKLAEAEEAMAARTPAAPTTPTPTPPPVVNAPPQQPPQQQPAQPAGPRIYSRDDKEVKPPVAITRALPSWAPPNPVAAKATFRGILEVVVDEKGAVTSSAVRQTVHLSYDGVLAAAAKKWTFEPATLNGEPVKYRLLSEIALSPGGVK